MIFKEVATHLASAGIAALLLFAMRPACDPQEGPMATRTNLPARSAGRYQTDVELIVAHKVVPANMRESRRNLFAYREVTANAEIRSVAPPVAAVPPEPPVVDRGEPLPDREPQFPYAYIGQFGPDRNPIAVFVGNSEVVNARVGEAITGDFRLRSIGIESAEITSGSGAIRRVPLQP